LNLLYVFIGGGLGSLVRFGISELVLSTTRVVFPIATLCSNFLSCLVLAIAIGMFNEKITAEPSLKLLIITGFCGGFSTFSTFSFETVDLMKSGNMGMAIANIFISMLTCFGVVYFLSRNA
jgi:CrcB protein